MDFAHEHRAFWIARLTAKQARFIRHTLGSFGLSLTKPLSDRCIQQSKSGRARMILVNLRFVECAQGGIQRPCDAARVIADMANAIHRRRRNPFQDDAANASARRLLHRGAAASFHVSRKRDAWNGRHWSNPSHSEAGGRIPRLSGSPICTHHIVIPKLVMGRKPVSVDARRVFVVRQKQSASAVGLSSPFVILPKHLPVAASIHLVRWFLQSLPVIRIAAHSGACCRAGARARMGARTLMRPAVYRSAIQQCRSFDVMRGRWSCGLESLRLDCRDRGRGNYREPERRAAAPDMLIGWHLICPWHSADQNTGLLCRVQKRRAGPYRTGLFLQRCHARLPSLVIFRAA